ncbi:hypothetical protein DL93DRAFT_2159705 [Clavulina sp. PMI_390]|nr:hypothetical protein DL93DRAFT_2159705 [Clavulina sp. PMI_390]
MATVAQINEYCGPRIVGNNERAVPDTGRCGVNFEAEGNALGIQSYGGHLWANAKETLRPSMIFGTSKCCATKSYERTRGGEEERRGETSQSPLNDLPAELLQHIMRFVVESPSQTGKVVRLSYWVHWPLPYVNKWLSHSASRPLECLVTPRPADDTFVALSLFQSRLTIIKIRLNQDYISEFTALFTAGAMGSLKHLSVSGCGGSVLDLSAAELPALETLYAPEMRITGPLAATPALHSFGSIMHSLPDFDAIEKILDDCRAITHVTLFASVPDKVFNIPEIPAVRGSTWSRLRSLRLHGYHDEDDEKIVLYLLSMESLRAKTLELVDLDSGILKKVLLELPPRAAASVETLHIIRAGHETDLIDYFKPLSTSIAPTVLESQRDSLPLPSIHSIIISSAPILKNVPTTHHWTLPMELLTSMANSRRDTLKHIVFSPILSPEYDRSSTGNPRTEASVAAAPRTTVPFTSSALRLLQDLGSGNPIEIGFAYTIDNHGFDMEPPDWT